jgi:hypothetical protein
MTENQQNWKSPKTKIGSVANGKFYYPRNNIVTNIWYELDRGNSILMAAPRRVGKTSIMQYLEKNPQKNYKMVFGNVQGIQLEKDFYKRIYELLLTCLNKIEKLKKWFQKYIKKIKIALIDGKLNIETLSLDFLIETEKLLLEINEKNEMENIVLLIDELPEVLFNINKNNPDGASAILKNLRRWRQESRMNRKVRFVFAGSIGMHYVVNSVTNRNSDINDLTPVPCEPLLSDEISSYIDWATESATVQYCDELKNDLAKKIQYFVPFFINLMLDEIDKIARKNNNPTVTKQTIDNAFDEIVKNNQHFEDWENRLKNYMPKKDFDFVNEILIHIAHRNQMSRQEIYDKAEKHAKTTDYMTFLNNLEKDGYIIEQKQNYVFVSPFLKSFWKRNNPIYNG